MTEIRCKADPSNPDCAGCGHLKWHDSERCENDKTERCLACQPATLPASPTCGNCRHHLLQALPGVPVGSGAFEYYCAKGRLMGTWEPPMPACTSWQGMATAHYVTPETAARLAAQLRAGRHHAERHPDCPSCQRIAAEAREAEATGTIPSDIDVLPADADHDRRNDEAAEEWEKAIETTAYQAGVAAERERVRGLLKTWCRSALDHEDFMQEFDS